MENYIFIQYVIQRSVYLLLPFTVCLLLILLFKKHADRLGVVDRPTNRKNHERDIPIIGGLAVYLSFALSVTVLTGNPEHAKFLFLSFLVLLVGFVDDLRDLPSILRLLLEALIAAAMVYWAGNQLNSIGSLFGSQPVYLSESIRPIFTIICVIGVINSINMIDGIDGLAGSTIVLSFIVIAFLGWRSGDFHNASIAVILCGSLIAFLCFNLRIQGAPAKIFMGDAGSMFLGFALCWFLIEFSQND